MGADEIDNEVLKAVGTVELIVISHWWGQLTDIDRKALNVKIIEGSNANTVAVAEWVLGAAIMGVRKIVDFHDELRGGSSWCEPRRPLGMMKGKTVGLVGMGRIGRYVSRLFNTLGCRVVAFDKYIDDTTLSGLGVARVGLDELFEYSDIISLHLPVTPSTTGLMGAEHFRKIKDGAVFINSARSALYDEAALVEELKKIVLQRISMSSTRNLCHWTAPSGCCRTSRSTRTLRATTPRCFTGAGGSPSIA